MNARPPHVRALLARGPARLDAPEAVSVWLWRVLFPSWRFFEAEDARFLLEARIVHGDQPPSPFLPAVPSVKRGLLALLFSPEHNLRLACHDLIERFVRELAERGPLPVSELESLVSYARVRQLTRFFLCETQLPLSDTRYQLRLLALALDDTREELFLSPYYPLG